METEEKRPEVCVREREDKKGNLQFERGNYGDIAAYRTKNINRQFSHGSRMRNLVDNFSVFIFSFIQEEGNCKQKVETRPDPNRLLLDLPA